MEYAFDSFEHTPANFRALRDMVGFKQDEFADIVGADRSEVRRWDSGKAPIPEVAWRALQGLVDDHFAAVRDVVTLAGKVSDPESEPVRITYYRSFNDFTGEGDWVSADNAARAAAERLIELGYRVEFFYPGH